MGHARLNKWLRRAQSPAAIVSIERFIDEKVFAVRAGGYGVMFQVRGIDSENIGREQLDEDTGKMVNAKNSRPGYVLIYEYLVKMKGYPLDAVSGQNAEHSFGGFVARERAEFLRKTAGLGRVELYWCLYIVPTKYKTPKEKKVNSQKAIRDLRKAAQYLQEQMRDVLPLRPMAGDEVGAFFSYLINLDERVACRKLQSAQHVNRQVVRSNIHWKNDHIRIGRRKAQYFSLLHRPGKTKPNLFGELLQLDCDMVLRSKWQPKTTAETRKEIGSQEGYLALFKYKIGTAIAHMGTGQEPQVKNTRTISHDKKTETLAGVLLDIETEGRRYGHYSLFGVVHGEDLSEVQELMPKISRIFNDPSEAAILEESDGAMSACYAMFPGNEHADKRSFWLRDDHAARMSFCYAPWTGETYSKDLKRESLAIFETRDITPFFLNPYVDGALGLLIAGKTGRGKSFLMNFLLMNALKYNPFLYVFDRGRSYESAILAANGVMSNIGLDGPRVNPFSLPETDDNILFLFEFIRMLLDRGGVKVKPEDETALANKIRDMYLLNPRVRRLGSLVLPRYMQPGLSKWVEGGVYGKIFDNVTDELAISRVQCFDFAGLGDKNPDLLEAILLWIIQRTESQIQDTGNLRSPKMLVFDEVWKSIRNRQLLDLILSGLKTGRKNRAGVMMATQHMQDLGDYSELIRSSCPISLLLGEPVINRKKYGEWFDMNDEELDNLSSLTSQLESFLKTPFGSKRLRLRVDEMSHALFTTDPNDREKRLELIAEHGFEKGIQMLALEGTAK
jgi:type IV secretion system protein VirB4